MLRERRYAHHREVHWSATECTTECVQVDHLDRGIAEGLELGVMGNADDLALV